MANEKYHIKWDTFTDHLKQMLQDLQNDESSKDVTLVCDDKTKIKAHQIVLKACSPVFASMLEVTQLNPIIYLRGVQHQELQPILQFMYLGEATFHQGRMNEFLNVAKSLEVKELNEGVTENDECVPVIDETFIQDSNFDHNRIRNKEEEHRTLSTFPHSSQCPECGKQFSRKSKLAEHFQSVHRGVKYPCDQCEYKATVKYNLTKHVKSKHEGVYEDIKYPCDLCEYQATKKGNLIAHVTSKHDGIKYSCSKCEYSGSKANLSTHIKSKHEGVRYYCNQCDYEAVHPSTISAHKKSHNK